MVTEVVAYCVLEHWSHRYLASHEYDYKVSLQKKKTKKNLWSLHVTLLYYTTKASWLMVQHLKVWCLHDDG